MTNMSMSSSLCLKFPLLVLQYLGTEDTNFLKWVMMPPRRQSRCFFFSNIMCEKLYIKKINPVFAIAKTKAEDNINIISLLNSAYKKIRMNDKMKHLRRCFRIAAHGYKDFYGNNKRWTIFLKWKSRVPKVRISGLCYSRYYLIIISLRKMN